MLREREGRLGKLKGSAVVGSMPRDADTVRAFVRLDIVRRALPPQGDATPHTEIGSPPGGR